MTRTPHCDDLLPWYVNGTLSPEEIRSVESHVEVCAACLRELERCRALAGLYEGIEDSAPAPHPARVERLWARAERSEIPNAFPWRALALVEAAALVLVILGLGWGLRANEPSAPADSGPAFRTLGAGSLEGPADDRFRVVFAPETPESDLRELLRTYDARIVDGPSPLGVYTIAVPRSSDLDDWNRLVVERLRGEDPVLFAEPSRRDPAAAEP